MDLIIHNYNNLIALGFSYNNVSYGDNYDEYNSALIILSYPNSTDKELNLYDYLKDNSNSTINDFSIDLEKYDEYAEIEGYNDENYYSKKNTKVD